MIWSNSNKTRGLRPRGRDPPALISTFGYVNNNSRTRQETFQTLDQSLFFVAGIIGNNSSRALRDLGTIKVGVV